MFFTPKPHRKSESGFTMIELLVVVIIIAILAAVAVPVYLNLRDSAARSALKADVNATVKKASIALTNGTSLDEITANNGADYVASSKARGEVISIVPADAPTTTPASFDSASRLQDGAFVARTATYGGAADGVARATAAVTANGQYFFVYGVLAKSAGAPVDYSYSYTSAGDKYSQGVGGGSSTTASAPVLAAATLPDATIGDPYPGATISATGTPAATYTATGLPAGLSLDKVSGALSGTSSDAAKVYTVHVTASNGVSSDTKDYSLTLKTKGTAPTLTNLSLPNGTTGTGYSQVLSTTGNPTPTVTVDKTTLPAGLNAVDNGNGTAKISGTPTTPGAKSVKITVDNGVGNPVVYTLSLTVIAGPVITMDFENTLDGFYFAGSSSSTTYVSNPTPQHGSYALQCSAGSSDYCYYKRDLYSLTPGKSYTLTGWLYRSGGSNNMNVGIMRSGGYLANYTSTKSGVWEKFSYDFTYQSGDYLSYVGTLGGTGYLDYITISG